MPDARQDDEGNSAAQCHWGVVWITASLFRWKNRGKSSHMPTLKLTPEIIAAAVEGYESQKEPLDLKIAELKALLSGGPAITAAAPGAPTLKRKSFRCCTPEDGPGTEGKVGQGPGTVGAAGHNKRPPSPNARSRRQAEKQ